jgi:hypothetical protein
MQIPCVYIPGPAPAVSVANNIDCALKQFFLILWLYFFVVLTFKLSGHFGDFGFGPHRFPGHPDFFPGGHMAFLGPHHGTFFR